MRPAQLENLDGPFRGDQRLVVGAGQHAAAVLKRQLDDPLRLDQHRGRDGFVVAQGLAGDPVLTEAAVEVAAQHAE